MTMAAWSARVALVVFAMVTLFSALPVRANGIDFFQDAREPGPNPLLYTGRVTDKAGKPLINARVYVAIKRLGIALEAHTDSQGRYQTHDVNRALEMIQEPWTPEDLEIFVQRPFYKQVTPTMRRVPPQNRGKLQIDFVMER